MSEEEGNQLKFENLVYRLNNLGIERQATLDKLWELEREATELRREVMAMINKGCKPR